MHYPLKHLALAASLFVQLSASFAAESAVALFPTFSSAEQVNQICDAGLKLAAERVAQLEKLGPQENWLAAYDDLGAVLEDASGSVTFIASVHPDAAVRAASEACDLRWQAFSSSLAQNERLYRTAKQVKPADEIDRQALLLALEGFEDAGISLPPVQRAKAKKLIDEIGQLGQQFEKNIREDKTRLAFSEPELAGVPKGVLDSASKDAKGRFLLSMDYPVFFPVMETAQLEATREKMWRAKNCVGGEKNIKILGILSKKRHELAALFGAASFDDFVLRRRMAGSMQAVNQFLSEVKQAITPGELRDFAEFRAAKAEHLGLPLAQTKLQRWDVQFYSERVRRARYQIDEEAFRPYFPPEASLKFVMRIAETLFGIRYTQVPATLWHPDAQAFQLSDASTGKPLATLLVDMYPREGKYKHAAVAPVRSGSQRLGRMPLATLMVNFDRRGLTLQELRTLLHEFGHSLHSNLSTARYLRQSGTNTVLDFVEAPSQMLEDWTQDPAVLALFKEVCPSCTPVPAELVAQARAARNFAKGSATARQHFYASYDLALHAAKPQNPLALWAHMEEATPLGHVKGSLGPANFGHLVGGYAAGYYGYLWSLVVATDLRTAFEGHRLDPAVGRRYRETVLSQGGQLPAAQLLRNFLGRETNSKAFFEDLNR